MVDLLSLHGYVVHRRDALSWDVAWSSCPLRKPLIAQRANDDADTCGIAHDHSSLTEADKDLDP
ncbi:hypothetical protein [Rhodanobacter hydrolyticus]|uniref:Uncharacterized protein n=1 Tax=Rhodanobacter hydrolyticus TaxID=2250595 RepID=A0ABW8J5K7_9GAMM